jgi:hypothetical protein
MSDETPEGHQQDTALGDSNPNAGGPERAAGGMGVSSERVGATGPGQESTDGERPTHEPPATDHAGDLVGSEENDQDTPPEQSTGGPETNPDPPIPPVAGYPSKNPASEDHPYEQDA